MVLPIRRLILNVLFILTFLSLIMVGAIWFAWRTGYFTNIVQFPSLTMSWWGVFRSYRQTDIFWALVLITIYASIGLLGEIYLRYRFGKNPCWEIFFLRLFLLLLSLQSGRALIFPALSGYISVFSGILITRIAWFGRFLGIATLLNMSLYSTEINLQKSRYMLGLGFVVSLAVSVLMPVDITQPMGNLLYRVGLHDSLALACLSLELIAVISMAALSRENLNNHYSLLALALFLVVSGLDLSFFGTMILSIIGSPIMIIGIILFSWAIKKIYYWV